MSKGSKRQLREARDRALPATQGPMNAIGITTTQARIEKHYSGPIPDPQTLKQFETIKPGLAERIVVMAERESEHRRTGEMKALEASIDNEKTIRVNERYGIYGGLAIGCVGLFVSMVLGIYGQGWSATIIGGSTLASLVGAFLKQSTNKDRRSQNEGKAQEEGQATQHTESPTQLQATGS